MKECFICLANICSIKSLKHVQILLDFDLIEVLIDYIGSGVNPDTIIEVIGALTDAFRTFSPHEVRAENHCLTKIHECNGLGVIEKLRTHSDEGVREAASKLFDDHLKLEKRL